MPLDCLSCELTRAKLWANTLLVIGTSPHKVAEDLNKRYGPYYYIIGRELLRKSYLPPYAAHLIVSF